jgi:hypothetical protein
MHFGGCEEVSRSPCGVCLEDEVMMGVLLLFREAGVHLLIPHRQHHLDQLGSRHGKS